MCQGWRYVTLRSNTIWRTKYREQFEPMRRLFKTGADDDNDDNDGTNSSMIIRTSSRHLQDLCQRPNKERRTSTTMMMQDDDHNDDEHDENDMDTNMDHAGGGEQEQEQEEQEQPFSDEYNEYSGLWFTRFKDRSILRHRWYHHRPHSVGHLDILQRELSNERVRDESFARELYIVGQPGDEREGSSSGGSGGGSGKYHVDVSKRNRVTLLTSDGEDRLVSADEVGRVKVWNLRTNQMVQMIDNVGVANADAVVSAIAATKDRLYVACQFHLFMFDMHTGLLLGELRSRIEKGASHELYGLNQSKKAANEPIVKMYISQNKSSSSDGDGPPMLYAVTGCGSIEVYDLSTNTFKYSMLFKRLMRRRRAPATVATGTGGDDESDSDDDAMQDNDLLENNGFTVRIDVDCGIVALSTSSKLKIYHQDSGICIQSVNANQLIRTTATSGAGATATPHIGIHCVRIVNSMCVAVILSVQDALTGSHEYFLRYFNVMSGHLIKNMGCKIKMRSEPRQELPEFFIDSDKIVCVNHFGKASSIFSINHGARMSSVPLNVNAHHATITSGLVNESYLIMGTSFGGIVAYNYGGSQFYWSGLTGGRSLTSQ